MRHLSAISLCFAAWSGIATVTPADGLATTVTPERGDSVASLMQRLVALLGVRTPATWGWSFDATGHVVLTSSGAFTWSATLDVSTRCGLASASSTAGVVTGSTAAAGVMLPDDGAATNPGIAAVIGSPSGTGSGVTAPRDASAGSLTVAGVPAGALLEIEEDAVGIFDVSDPGGRVWHRQVVSGWVRTYPGTAPVLAVLAPDGPSLLLPAVPA